MPRGQNSKLRARKKRHQAQDVPLDVKGDEANAAVKEESMSSFTPSVKNTPQNMPAARSCNNDEVVPSTRANEDATYQASPSSRQVQPTIEQLQKTMIEKKVIALVHYLLYKYKMKELITKTDIMKTIVQIYRNHYSKILQNAADYLELVFGLDLKEMDPNRHIYVLVNKLELSYDVRISDEIGVPKTGLLMVVLGVIFTKGKFATEKQVWEVLNVIGLYPGKNHFIFGEPKKIITRDMVKQKYLEYRQVPNSDPPSYEFRWGPRAYAETTKMKVLEFLAKVHDTTPQAFPSWYEEALRDEEERAHARAAARARISAVAEARSRALSKRSSCSK
ncbi:PREDICTED: melanoma-associated antigen B10-like [Chrysochloris asiatica]|uniref:Melanoma-associated antigen B10-like n=1 Tax=Chrysochloris asiatica TaxID=185453 RepID=A0A9B0T1W8_CHRAS|nr:PREDICTED: melanoma-associated antigen B10-like [Chrysochloris asiatica]